MNVSSQQCFFGTVCAGAKESVIVSPGNGIILPSIFFGSPFLLLQGRHTVIVAHDSQTVHGISQDKVHKVNLEATF